MLKIKVCKCRISVSVFGKDARASFHSNRMCASISSAETIKAFLTEFCETNESGAKFFKYSTQLTNIAHREQVITHCAGSSSEMFRYFSHRTEFSGGSQHWFGRFVWIQWLFGRRHCSKHASLFVTILGCHIGVAAIVQGAFDYGKGLTGCVHRSSFDDGSSYARHKRATRRSQSIPARTR